MDRRQVLIPKREFFDVILSNWEPKQKKTWFSATCLVDVLIDVDHCSETDVINAGVEDQFDQS